MGVRLVKFDLYFFFYRKPFCSLFKDGPPTSLDIGLIANIRSTRNLLKWIELWFMPIFETSWPSFEKTMIANQYMKRSIFLFLLMLTQQWDSIPFLLVSIVNKNEIEKFSPIKSFKYSKNHRGEIKIWGSDWLIYWDLDKIIPIDRFWRDLISRIG